MLMKPENGDAKVGGGLPEVSIVILNWNGKKYLEKFLPSVLASTYPNKRVIVADNASTDDSLALLTSSFPGVEIIQNSTNEGFAKGYNTALAQIKSDYFVLLNSDVEVADNWIEPVISLMERDHSIGACQPKILSYNNKAYFEYAGASGGWIDSLGFPFSRGRVFEVLEEDKGQYDQAGPCFWASGAALFVRAPLYTTIGGLEAFFFAHQEEIDFCWRLQRAGYKVYIEPASVVYHVGGGTLEKHNNFKVFLNFRNNLVMLTRNLPVSVLVRKLPIKIALDAIAAWKSLLEGNKGFFIAVAKAHLAYFKWIFSKRKGSDLPKKDITSFFGCYEGSIVWKHFIQKKNRFSEIIGNK